MKSAVANIVAKTDESNLSNSFYNHHVMKVKKA
jgi:hypothetical protein